LIQNFIMIFRVQMKCLKLGDVTVTTRSMYWIVTRPRVGRYEPDQHDTTN
jgi:hypothetical protein